MSMHRSLLFAVVAVSAVSFSCGPAPTTTEVGVAMRWHGTWEPASQAALRAIIERAGTQEGEVPLRYAMRADREARLFIEAYARDAVVPAHEGSSTRTVTADGVRISLYPEATESLLRAGVELDQLLGGVASLTELRALPADAPGGPGCRLGLCTE